MGSGGLGRPQRVVGTAHPGGEHRRQDEGGHSARPSGHTVLPVEVLDLRRYRGPVCRDRRPLARGTRVGTRNTSGTTGAKSMPWLPLAVKNLYVPMLVGRVSIEFLRYYTTIPKESAFRLSNSVPRDRCSGRAEAGGDTL